MEEKLKDKLSQLRDGFETFMDDALKGVNGNKAAATRARVASMAVREELKNFKKLSIDHKHQ